MLFLLVTADGYPFPEGEGGGGRETVLHHPKWKTSFEGEKPRLSRAIGFSRSRQDFRISHD